MADINETATTLKEQLKTSDEFKKLADAYDKMKAEQATFDLFKNFQEIQLNIQQKQIQGQQLTEEEMTHAREVADKVGQADAIKVLMDAEKGVNDLLSKLNDEITKPIQDLYRN
ncbi:hypothetical protein AYR62_07255 [Secundilactobacillus paracollinoides]|uniref:UPF0342 protein AYR63_14145 n=1 Tax=Secundilactobacillus paracollinoides TaxID=240427 RepID=A0A1B2J1E0_9LACO|nr:YlbF family regulator [Secundilactobacillus paracollinoides]ANZ62219.1 hypothetical protein AYR61_13270 [Secundilactobacillus paracollinoides]ANZ63907.1 hypothetical protein AYR62_07255 [Secundilactobacillus paracollinoides]ANZ68166.1 hypothetical protein AYR63_14145 [Secundilactobacillus paracollinoides]KRL76349.1 hypothetical protein FC17_GL001852 [Secundilactobacillus paracollinoides DSM 15502 = JCM 11969]